MKRWVGAAIVLAVAGLTTARGQQPVRPAPEYVPGEVLVQYRRTVQPGRRDAILATRRGRLVRRFDQLEIDHVTLDAFDNVAAAVAAFRAMPQVAAASPNYIRHAVQAQSPPPNDPAWLNGSLWGLVKIQAQSAWNTLNARGDGSVVIMDIDTGMNYNHQDLAANVWTNPGETANGIDDDNDGYIDDIHGIDTVNHDSDPIDDNGHGTHTAGTIAAAGNNALGVVGVNWNAKLLPCKFLNAAGSGSDAGAAECLNYAVTLKTQHHVNIRVTNNSWGGYRNGGDVSVLQNAFAAAGNAGIISFAAAGNGDSNGVGLNIDIAGNEFDPASLSTVEPSIVAVAASDSNDNRASFSNYGPNSVALAAPGTGILSTWFSANNMTYATASGTSMATPHVAGVAALLSSMDSALNVAQLKALITGSVDVLPQWGGLVTTGGRLNLFTAANVIGPVGGLPPPWVAQDIGTVGAAGSAAAASGTFTVKGAGSDIYGTADAFQFVWQPLTGDGQIVAHVVSIQNTNAFAKAGVMMRQSLTAGSIHTAVVVKPSSGLAFERRKTTNGTTTSTTTPGIVAPTWLKLARSGTTVTASQSPDGMTWTVVGTDTVALGTPVDVGLVVTSHQAGTLATGVFDNVTVLSTAADQPPTAALTAPANNAVFTAPATVPMSATASDPDTGDTIDHVTFLANGSPIGSVTTPQSGVYHLSLMSVAAGSYLLTVTATDNHGLTGPPSAGVAITVNPSGAGLPPGWVAQDIGNVGATGSATAASGTFTVKGAGADIYGTADAFQFVFQQSLTGDGQIVAHVVSIQNTNAFAKAGVMMRQGLTAGSIHAAVVVKPSSGLAFERRKTTNGTTTSTTTPGIVAPTWLKLARSGTTVTASQSPDGMTWTVVGTDTVALGTAVDVGLVVTSHQAGTLATGVFDSISITGFGGS